MITIQWPKTHRIAFSIVLIYFILSLFVWFGLIGSEAESINAESFESCSFSHFFGTNFNGQDIFQRTLQSATTAFEIGIVVSVFLVTLGIFLGSFSGFFYNSFWDYFWVYVCSCIDCVPFYLMVALVSYSFNSSQSIVYISMALSLWTSSFKVIRTQIIQMRSLQFVLSAYSIGTHPFKIVIWHILPNLMPFILVEMNLLFITAIKIETILSFLGISPTVERASWGVMLAEATSEILMGKYNNFLAASSTMSLFVVAFTLLNYENLNYTNYVK